MATKNIEQTMLTLATMVTWFNELTLNPPKELDKPTHIRRAAQGENHAQKLLNALVAAVGEYKTESVLNKVNNYTMELIPKDKAIRAANTMVVNRDDVEYILSRCFADCATCLKNEAEVKACKMRKVLTRMEVILKGTPRGECPYQP